MDRGIGVKNVLLIRHGATAGNLAFPFSPSDVKGGAIYVFSVYGLLKGEDPLKLFPARYEMIGG